MTILKWFNFFFLVGVLMNQLNGQQLSLASNVNNVSQLYNPAAWNSDILKYPFLPKNGFYSYFRSQWTALDLGPKYADIHYEHYSNTNTIVGLGLSRDSYGPLSFTELSGRYAYRIKFNQRYYLCGGANIAMLYSNYNPNVLNIREQNDPLAEKAINSTGIAFSPGFFFSTIQPNDIIINAGISYQNAVSLLFSDLSNFKPYSTILIHASIIKFQNASYGDASYYEISGMYRNSIKLSDDLELSLKYQYRGLISLRSGLRMGVRSGFELHAAQFGLGLPLTRALKWQSNALDLNYSTEIPLGNLNFKFGLTHEVSLGFLF